MFKRSVFFRGVALGCVYVLQGDTSGLKQLEHHLSAIHVHIEILETILGFKVIAMEIREILSRRAFYFENDCIKLYRLLEPS